jgi:hypothetical protein
MKKLISTFVISLLFAVGCTEQMSVNTPVDNSTKKVKWLTISDNSGLSVEGSKTWSKSIIGTNGGLFRGTKSLSANISAFVEVWVPAGAFTGTKTISATLNSETLYADFAPTPMTFNTPIYYTVEYFGVNLEGIDPTTVDFYYIDGSGNMVKAEYSEIYVEEGWLCVVDAKIPHFSRYGFVN